MKTYFTTCALGKEKEAVENVRKNNGISLSKKITFKTLTKNNKNKLKLLKIEVK